MLHVSTDPVQLGDSEPEEPVATPTQDTEVPAGGDGSTQSQSVPLSIWIAAGTVALLVMVFVGVCFAVCCIVYRRRRASKTPKAPPSDEPHHYDYIDLDRIYTLTREVSHNLPAATHTLVEEYDNEEMEYIDMAEAEYIDMAEAEYIDMAEAEYIHMAEADQPLQTFSGTATLVSSVEEPEYMSIDAQTLPASPASETARGGMMDNAAYMNSMEMTTNVAYPAIKEHYESSGEYI